MAGNRTLSLRKVWEMSIDPIKTAPPSPPPKSLEPPPLIDGDVVKAILYLGIMGDVKLPGSEKQVDILV